MARAKKQIKMTLEEMVEKYGWEDGPREDYSHLSEEELDALIEEADKEALVRASAS